MLEMRPPKAGVPMNPQQRRELAEKIGSSLIEDWYGIGHGGRRKAAIRDIERILAEHLGDDEIPEALGPMAALHGIAQILADLGIALKEDE
jgi:hypothetical protein